MKNYLIQVLSRFESKYFDLNIVKELTITNETNHDNTLYCLL